MKQSGTDEGNREAGQPAGDAARNGFPRDPSRWILGLIVAVFLAHTALYNFISDDAFITLRYARSFAEGRGLVFNPGERVEGFTSPLWTLLLAGMQILGQDRLVSARTLGILFGALALLLAFRLVSAAAGRPVSPWVAAIAPLVLALNGPFACWAASGMETPLFAALILASLLGVMEENPRMAIPAIVGLILVRPEGAAVFALLAGAQAIRYRATKDRRILVWFATGAATLAALFVFRRLYYGDWLPNTYYAKTGGGGLQVLRGLYYFAGYAADHESLAVLGALVAYGLGARTRGPRILALGAAGLWAAAILSGGDGLPMYRFALAPLVLTAALTALAFESLFRRTSGGDLRAARAAVLTGLVLLLAGHATRPLTGTHYMDYLAQKKVEVPRWSQVGRWLRDNAREGDTVAAVPIGAVAYYSGLPTLDMLGLTDRHIAHRRMPGMGTGWAGHEKCDGPYILGRRPTFLLLGNIDVTDPPRDPSAPIFIPYSSRGVWEREKDFYDTGELNVLYEPRSVEIAPGQYLNFYSLRDEYRPKR